jgi:hypothetical protein
MVIAAWFFTPEVHVDSDTADSGYTTVRCENAGPSRWEPPTVHPGQELANGDSMQSFNLQVLKNDIESLRVGLACDQARASHTNTLIVATFTAATLLLVGYAALWTRRDSAASTGRQTSRP